MKTFKQYLDEGHSYRQAQWDDYDVVPSAANALEALNSMVGSVGQMEVLNPELAVRRLQTEMAKFGYNFDLTDFDRSGTTKFPVKYGSGSFEVDRDTNTYGEFKEDDGISKHIEGGISLMVTVTPSANGKHMVEAEIVRNLEDTDFGEDS
tara:strand:- start:796 stop:1245 length:450 start_codon:yes stop_codon:yes gene_type:complete